MFMRDETDLEEQMTETSLRHLKKPLARRACPTTD